MLLCLALLLACSSSARYAPKPGASVTPGPNSNYSQPQLSLLWPSSFYRYIWPNSLVLDNVLYIDGGEIYTGEGGGYTFASTLAIQLTSSWDTANVTATAVDKPVPFPYARQSWFWSEGDSKLRSLGGWAFSEVVGWYSGAGQYGLATITDPTLWEHDTKVSSPPSAAWVQSTTQPPSSGPDQVSLGGGYLQASSNTSTFALGGALVKNVTTPAMGYTGMAVYDLGAAEWHHISTTNTSYGPNGWGAYGQAVYVPSYGTQGIIVFLGGYTPLTQSFTWSSPQQESLLPLDHIYMYDIASQQFFEQPATGPIPGPRWAFCAVGVEDANGVGFDIFIHGGTYGAQTQIQYQPGYNDIWVLSLPSFQWTQVNGSAQTMRAVHSCNVIGNRQMVVIGGNNVNDTAIGATPDPWPNALGIFDMTALRWSTTYNASQGPYVRSTALSNAIGSNTFPSSGSSTLASSIFGDSTSHGKSNAGAIAGGVVGGVVGLIAILALLWFLVLRPRRRRSRRSQSVAGAKPELESESDLVMRKYGTASPGTEHAKQLAGDEPSRTELEGFTNISELEWRPIPRDQEQTSQEEPEQERRTSKDSQFEVFETRETGAV